MTSDEIAGLTPAGATDEQTIRSLVRRVLESRGRDLNANEELKFLELGDPFNLTEADSHADSVITMLVVLEEVHSFINGLIADGKLDEAEDVELRSALMAVGGSEYQSGLESYGTELLAARAMGGTLPAVDSGSLLTRGDEVVHLTTRARLLHEVTTKEYVGGSQGFTIYLGLGVSYRTSAFKGRLVPVSTSLETQDVGDLLVTSARTVFIGDERTIEIPHSRIIAVTVYSDAVVLHSSGGAAAPILHVEAPLEVVRMIEAASLPVRRAS